MFLKQFLVNTSVIFNIIASIFAFFLGLIVVILKWSSDSKLEKYYSSAVSESIKEDEYFDSSLELPRSIIIDSGSHFSLIRTFLKKTWVKIRNGNPPPIVYVFTPLSENERKAFVIQQAFNASMNIELLDLEFIEDLINYRTHKYCENLKKIEIEVKKIIRKKFESSPNREILLKLDSLEFDNSIVLNPPPENKPLIWNVILPMVREQQKALKAKGNTLINKEKWKAIFMDIIKRICQRTGGVIFIGFRTSSEYTEWVKTNIEILNLFVFAARGSKIKKMVKICNSARDIISKKWGLALEENTIKGTWILENREEIDCMWIIARKI